MKFIKSVVFYFLGLYQFLVVEIQKKFIKANKEYHQLTSTTKENRYPLIFEECSILVKNPEKILSFGCSTGEEVFTLNRFYYPSSNIIGLDISDKNLKKAREKLDLSSNTIFQNSTEENLKGNAPYDIIFAMSVLCRWEDTKGITDCSKIYPFQKFEEQIEKFYNVLKVSGLLVIYNANFRFSDCSISKEFELISSSKILESGFVPKFDKRNKLLKDQSYPFCIFRKNT